MGLDLFALAMMLLGAWMMIHPFLTARKVKESETWPTTDAEIIESEVKATGARNLYNSALYIR